MNIVKTSFRLILGLVVIVLVASFLLLIFTSWVKIWNISLLTWFPLMMAGVGYYFAGRINRSTKPVFLLILFGAFPIYHLVGLIYFPQVLLVIGFALIGLLASRKELKPLYRKVTVVISVVVLLFFFARDPLVIIYKNGVYTTGEPVFTYTLWKGFKNKTNTIPKGTYFDRDGNEVDLREFEGKEVYVTFWATWCGACKYHEPELINLKNSEAARDIVFVDISIDQDQEKWNKYFENNERKGVQLIAKSPSKTKVDFQFQGIPHYVSIKSDGKVYPTARPEDLKPTADK